MTSEPATVLAYEFSLRPGKGSFTSHPSSVRIEFDPALLLQVMKSTLSVVALMQGTLSDGAEPVSVRFPLPLEDTGRYCGKEGPWPGEDGGLPDGAFDPGMVWLEVGDGEFDLEVWDTRNNDTLEGHLDVWDMPGMTDAMFEHFSQARDELLRDVAAAFLEPQPQSPEPPRTR